MSVSVFCVFVVFVVLFAFCVSRLVVAGLLSFVEVGSGRLVVSLSKYMFFSSFVFVLVVFFSRVYHRCAGVFFCMFFCRFFCPGFDISVEVRIRR